MGLPSINISFKEKATTAIARGERGIVGLILKDAYQGAKSFTVLSEDEIPTGLSAASKKQIAFALKGYTKAPKKVVCYVLPVSADSYAEAYAYFETVKRDIMAAPTVETDGLTSEFVSWIKKMADAGKPVMAVLPNVAADYPNIINYATNSVKVDGVEYDAESFCARIAGLIAGTPLTISCTFAPLPEVEECEALDSAALNAAIDAGKFVLYNDGEKVKVARGVTSFVTTTQEQGKQYKKIKLVNAMNIMLDDIKKTAEDSYLGKYANSYDNKCLLMSAIGGYFDQMILDGVLSSASIGIDVDSQRVHIKSEGGAVEDMSEQDIKVYNTGDKVFLKAAVSILDAIEEINLPINI